MTAKSPVACDSHSPTSPSAADGSLTNILTCMDDNNLIVSCFKLGKDDDACRVEYQGDFRPDSGDTVTVALPAHHQIDWDLELVAHTAASTVTLNNKIVILNASLNVGANVFTFTTAFVDELVQFNTDRWAVRFQLSVYSDGGDAQTAEVDADITPEGAGLSIPVAMATYRRRRIPCF